MKTTKRFSIELRHREVSILVAGSTLYFRDSEPDTVDAPTFCPTCGSRWITLAARPEGDVPATVHRIQQALQQSGLHVQVTAAGRLQICQTSFEEIKEQF